MVNTMVCVVSVENTQNLINKKGKAMKTNEPLPVDNTGTGKLGSIRVLTKKEKAIQKECIKQLNKYWEENE